jgi:hypothetical protein
MAHAIIRGKNGRRHEVDFGDSPVRVEVHASEETVEIFVEADFETHAEGRRRFAVTSPATSSVRRQAKRHDVECRRIVDAAAATNSAPLPYSMSWPRAPHRASGLVQNGWHGQGQESWMLDKEIAENALAYFEAKARNPNARPRQHKWTAVLLLCGGTGISLDWLFIGDPGNLISSLVHARQRDPGARGNIPVVLHPKRKTAQRSREVIDLEKERARRRQPDGPQGPSDQPAA